MRRFTGSAELTAATTFSVKFCSIFKEFSVRKVYIIYIAASVPAAPF